MKQDRIALSNLQVPLKAIDMDPVTAFKIFLPTIMHENPDFFIEQLN